MKFTLIAATVALALGTAGHGVAQETAPAAPAAPATPAPAAADAAALSDETIAKFAKVMMHFQDMKKQGKALDQDSMAAVLTEVAISIDDYNAVTTSMQKDPAVNDRVQAAYRSAVLASQPPEDAAPAQN